MLLSAISRYTNKREGEKKNDDNRWNISNDFFFSRSEKAHFLKFS